MPPSKVITVLFSTLLLLSACGRDPATEPAQPADLILTNARVYSLNWPDPHTDGRIAAAAPYQSAWFPDAQAVAIRGGEIVFVGSDAEASAWHGATTRSIDLQGASVLPGLVDSHTHVFQLGLSLNRVNLYDVDTEVEAVARIAERARSVPPGEWIVGQGWN